MPSNRYRRAMTLVELLVVLAIIGILLGLIMSAVQQIRATAERLRCGNQLRQIALASHQYHDVNGQFPSAFRIKDSYPYLHWQVRLLPYCEQGSIWQSITEDYRREPNPFKLPTAHRFLDRPLSLFGCAADWRTRTAWTVETFGPTRRLSVTSYLGNSGATTGDQQGVFFQNSRIALIHIFDGTSNTLLMVERPPSFNLVYGWWYAAEGQDGQGSLDSVLAAREKNHSAYPSYRACGGGPFQFSSGRVEDPCSVFHPWSLHSGGANFAFADGSVRFLRYSANDILPALATRAGGEVVAIPD
jgi:prepilin-type N-terminal cleavage/methylation domain-containing protein/prepilin-type processing-associated H-X9-DG protein